MTNYIKINGIDYPIKGGYYALKHTKRELAENGVELTLSRILQGDIEVLEPLLFFALKMGHHLEQKGMTLLREEMEYALDACMVEFVRMLPQFFPNEELMGKSEPGGDETQEKPNL